MNNVENRYREYQNAPKQELEEIKTLFLDTRALADYYIANFKSFDHILAIYKCESGNELFEEYCNEIEDATDNVFNLTNLNNPEEEITLYRGVELGPNDVEPDIERPGMCWTFNRDTAERFVSQFDDNNDPDFAPCILYAKFKAKDIDWLYSVACQIDEPDEEEVRIFKDAKPLEIEYEVL